MPPAEDHAREPRPTPRLPVKLIIRVAVPLVVVIGIIALVSGSRDTRTVAQVIDEIRGIALDEPRGGLIGPWWVSAAGIDPLNGRLQDFKIEFGPIHIAARSARIIVNPHTDTFSFEMWDVVMARPDIEDGLLELNRYVLGPLPYPKDVVADGSVEPLAR